MQNAYTTFENGNITAVIDYKNDNTSSRCSWIETYTTYSSAPKLSTGIHQLRKVTTKLTIATSIFLYYCFILHLLAKNN